MKFFETSSKTNKNVKETFETLTLEMIEEYDNNHNNTEEASTRHTIEISQETNKKANEKSNKKEKCCH